MSNPSPESQDGSDKAITTACVLLGAVVFVFLNQYTRGKVPGGAIGGAIGGVLGGFVSLGINALRRK